MIAVGLGCLYFDRKDVNDKNISIDALYLKTHCEILRKELEMLPNVKNVEINEPSLLSLVQLYGSVERFSTEYNFFPFVWNLEINFLIELPLRIQDEILTRKSRTESELFNVNIEYFHDTPVTFITYSTESMQATPSDGVVAVRKFLQRHFDANSKIFSFKTLGPSPFHANFYLAIDEAATADQPPLRFEDESLPGVGYSDFKIIFNKNKIGAEVNTLQFFRDLFSESISVYYKAVLFRYDLMLLSIGTRNNMSELINIQKRQGIKGFFDRIRFSPKINRDLMISFLQIETVKTEFSNYIQICRRNRSLLSETPFEEFVEKEQNDINTLPISHARDAISLFEERYLKNIENSTVLVAGLLGGIIGSIITYLVGK